MPSSLTLRSCFKALFMYDFQLFSTVLKFVSDVVVCDWKTLQPRLCVFESASRMAELHHQILLLGLAPGLVLFILQGTGVCAVRNRESRVFVSHSRVRRTFPFHFVPLFDVCAPVFSWPCRSVPFRSLLHLLLASRALDAASATPTRW